MTDGDRVMRHALERLDERFGMTISQDDYHRLCAEIAPRLRRPDGVSPTGKPVYEITIGTFVVCAAWNDAVQQIGTFHHGELCRMNGKRRR